MGCGLQPRFLGPLPFPLLLWNWPCDHSFLHCDQVSTGGSLRGLGSSRAPGPQRLAR